MYTGSNGDDEIGYLRIVNQASYANKLTEINNGTNLVNITQPDPSLDIVLQELNAVSGGLQFPPNIEEDDQLKIYDQRNIKVVPYTHQSSSSLKSGDKNELQVDTFAGMSHGDNVGFAYNLPVFEKPYGCFGCYQNPDEFRSVQVDGNQYQVATSDSDNFLTVQLDSGYTYQIKKQSTVYMIIGGNQTYAVDDYHVRATPFPHLDPIYGAPWPFYDFSENLQANEDVFTQRFAYIAEEQRKTKNNVIAMSVMAGFFLILAIVTISVYKLKDPKRRANSDEETLMRSANSADGLIEE